MDQSYLEQYRDQGFAVIKGVFSPDEIQELQAAFNRVYAQGMPMEEVPRRQCAV